MRKRKSVGLGDRFISAFSYLTVGWGGLICCVILYLQKKVPSQFVRYNVMQSIFISLLYFCLSFGLGLILKFLSYIPFLNYFVASITFQFNRPVLFNYSFIQLFMSLLILFLIMMSLMGRYPRVFWISKIVDRNVR